VRLFAAVNLPDRDKAQLAQILDELRNESADVRWVSADSLHLTLKFLGEVADGDVDSVRTALARAAGTIPVFQMTVRGFGTFPAKTRARVFWIGVEGPAELYQLRESVEREIAPLGFPTEKRSFQAHITLGRVRANGRVDSTTVDRMARHVGYNAVTTVRSADLMRSYLSPHGARYELLYAAGLKT